MTDWEWIADFEARARTARDAERLRLVSLLRQGQSCRERDPGQCLTLYGQGLALARHLHEPWWVLYFQAWTVSQLVHQSRDFRRALDLAVAAALEARKPLYDGCPFRPQIYLDLLAVHFGIDPLGYADRIEEGFRDVERLLPDDFTARLHLLNLRRWCAQQSRQHEAHYTAAQRALALIASDPGHHSSLHYSTFIYNGLCRVHYARQQWQDLGQAADLAWEASSRVGNQVEKATASLWQALVQTHAGNASRGHHLRLRGVRLMEALGVPPPDGYFDALSLGHEHAGEWENALAVRDRELSGLVAQGRTVSEVYCHRERCRLLAATGRLTPVDLDAGRAAARRLRFPEPHLAALDQIADRGRVSE
jgi:hypothetical protein